MTIFALVDCNNFYVSCERAFNPRLSAKPVVVLSNNDGCVISRSNEAKKLGIPMGAPYFKWKSFCKAHDVQVFSSNYELYGDMSHRVMVALKSCCPEMEIYSIDEAFLVLDKIAPQNLTAYLLDVRHKIKKWTGIPVSIGVGETKTLAKIANYIAKNKTTEFVYSLLDLNSLELNLAEIPIEKIWGIGYRLALKLKNLNLHTALDMRNADPKRLRMHFSVTVEKTVQELRGISCIGLEVTQPRKQIISSRSFGKYVTELSDLEEAISHYAAIASLKLRNQGSLAKGIVVFLETNRFQDNALQRSVSFPFSEPSADTSYIIRIAKKCIKHIYKKGYRYQKAGLMLLDLAPNSIKQYDMLSENNHKRELLVKSVDLINKTMGKNTVFYCAEGIKRSWQIKRDYCSPRYTTCWEELAMVY